MPLDGQSRSVEDRVREAAQDRGAQLGLLSTQSDAYGLGEAGIAAVRVALTEALDVLERAYHPQHGENPAHPYDVLYAHFRDHAPLLLHRERGSDAA